VLAEAVRRVQRVHVGALQPVRRHRDVVDQQVAVLEGAAGSPPNRETKQ
jgi:hypothetical protein